MRWVERGLGVLGRVPLSSEGLLLAGPLAWQGGFRV